MPGLSKRLQMLADMVTPGNRLADIGCDHGFLSIYLVHNGICPEALAMDVRKGPLAGARKHVDEYGLGEYIKIRLSDGLAEYGAGEADTLVCAGMGGRLMEKILTEGMDKACQAAELILQPQSELQEFRAFLRKAGFAVTEENAVYEEGKYYFAMKAVWGRDKLFSGKLACGGHREAPGGNACDGGLPATVPDEIQRLYDLYGELLLKQRHPVLLQYLTQRLDYMKQLERSLEAAGSGKAKMRLGEIRRELEDIEGVMRQRAQRKTETGRE